MSRTNDAPRRTCPGVTAEQATARPADGGLVLDVRSPDAWADAQLCAGLPITSS